MVTYAHMSTYTAHRSSALQSDVIIGIWFSHRFHGYMRCNWIKFQLKILRNLVFVCHSSEAGCAFFWLCILCRWIRMRVSEVRWWRSLLYVVHIYFCVNRWNFGLARYPHPIAANSFFVSSACQFVALQNSPHDDTNTHTVVINGTSHVCGLALERLWDH